VKSWNLILILVLVVGALVGCGGDSVDPASQGVESGEGAAGESYASATLDTSYEGALPVGSQLALGTLELEGTENAVTPEQAQALLPLWQAIQGGSLQAEAEVNAVLKQIEGAMSEDQLAAIAAMQLTYEDMGGWMEEQGLAWGSAQGAGGGPGAAADMTEEERAAMRATRQASGEAGGKGGAFAELSEEERAAKRATAEASGSTGSSRRAGGGLGQMAALAGPVVELLGQRAGD